MDKIQRALHYRNLAEEARIKALALKSQGAQIVLEKLAADYDTLAESLERAAKLEGNPRPQKPRA